MILVTHRREVCFSLLSKSDTLLWPVGAVRWGESLLFAESKGRALSFKDDDKKSAR